jgi:hypothetical protein
VKTRLFTILSGGTYAKRVKHYLGIPPELAAGVDSRKEMESALFLVIENNADGTFLYRFDASGDCVGDTWHMTVEDAKQQAAFEFEGCVSNWQEIPQTVKDVAIFGLDAAKEA